MENLNVIKDVIGKWKYPGKKFIYEKQVLLRQTNVFGNTYFLNYVEWQGEAREKFIFEHPSARLFLKNNQYIRMITHSLYHRFLNNTFFGDSVQIEVTAKEISRHSFILVFEYFNERHDMIGEGWQKIGFYDEKQQMLCPVPQIFLDLLLPVVRDKK